MSKYIATVRYTIGNHTLDETFAARAKCLNFVKEQYHRYVHENYHSIDRSQEDAHIHEVGHSGFTVELMDVKPVDEVDLYGHQPIARL